MGARTSSRSYTLPVDKLCGQSSGENEPWEGFRELCALLKGKRIALLTGAGCSTESGIPDYRGPETRKRARNPVQYREFVDKPQARRRYWARALVGWSRFSATAPNEGHQAMAQMERRGVLTGTITQNVDRLHTKAGTERLVELHGALEEVICLDCGILSSREELQERLWEVNPDWLGRRAEIAPDGDTEIDDTEGFVVVDCVGCGGRLKPHVVFFGENVPRRRVERAWRIVRDAEVLLVVGSSLAVFSGYRFPRGFAAEGGHVAIVNLGPTRADGAAKIKVKAKSGALLPRLVHYL